MTIRLLQPSELEKRVSRDFDMLVCIPDVHAPFHDKKTQATINHFLSDKKPDIVLQIGDLVDMYAVSRYDKNPERAQDLQTELDSAHDYLEKIRNAVGADCRIKYVRGNHEERLQKYLWRNPELHGLRALDLPELLGLKDLGVEYVDEWFWKDTFLFTHGKRCGVYSARQNLDDYGVSGMSGHDHRVMVFERKDRKGERVWYSIGHVADSSQSEYVKEPNWHQAIGVVYLSKKNTRFYATVVPITEHKFLFDGKVYSPKGIKQL